MLIIFTFFGVPQFRPIRHMLKPACFHFCGGASGYSAISNSNIIVGMSLSKVSEDSSISPMVMGPEKILLKNIVPSSSFQKGTIFPRGDEMGNIRHA